MLWNYMLVLATNLQLSYEEDTCGTVVLEIVKGRAFMNESFDIQIVC